MPGLRGLTQHHSCLVYVSEEEDTRVADRKQSDTTLLLKGQRFTFTLM